VRSFFLQVRHFCSLYARRNTSSVPYLTGITHTLSFHFIFKLSLLPKTACGRVLRSPPPPSGRGTALPPVLECLTTRSCWHFFHAYRCVPEPFPPPFCPTNQFSAPWLPLLVLSPFPLDGYLLQLLRRTRAFSRGNLPLKGAGFPQMFVCDWIVSELFMAMSHPRIVFF